MGKSELRATLGFNVGPPEITRLACRIRFIVGLSEWPGTRTEVEIVHSQFWHWHGPLKVETQGTSELLHLIPK